MVLTQAVLDGGSRAGVVIRTGSGRRLALCGGGPEIVAFLQGQARRLEVGVILIGGWGLPEGASPALAGPTALLVDARRSGAELEGAAAALQAELDCRGWSEVRVCAGLRGRIQRCEDDVIDELAALLAGGESSMFSPKQSLARELYFPINLPRRLLMPRDFGNGLLGAAVFSASFSFALGFHPIAPTLGFIYGLFGRYLGRARAGIAFALGNGPAGNAAAMAADGVHGVALMALVICPAAGLEISLRRIVWTSISHTLSKGALRLFLDKHFSVASHDRQALGVTISTLVDLCHGLTTNFLYAGSAAAGAIQAGLACWGVWIHFWPRKPMGTS
ncbi:MAG: hypothetical protein AAB268_11670 [Elusimicrobiota bacterium]